METIILSQKGISDLATLNTTSADSLKKICKYILQQVVVGSSNVVIDEDCEGALSGITALFYEATRVRADEKQVKASLTEHGVVENVAQMLSDVYAQHHDAVVAHFEKIGISSPKIVDIEWRLDYSIRSKQCGRINIPMYFIKLKVKEGEEIRTIDMIASLEELQDMLAKVRDAVKEVERVLNMPDMS